MKRDYPFIHIIFVFEKIQKFSISSIYLFCLFTGENYIRKISDLKLTLHTNMNEDFKLSQIKKN